MVTRTITINSYEVMCLDVKTCEVQIAHFELVGDTLPEAKAMESLKKLWESDSFKLVTIQGVETSEALYGIPEAEFILHATKLDPVTRKPL